MNHETKRTLPKAQREEFEALFPEAKLEIAAHLIPSNALQKELIRRHVKNDKDLLAPQTALQSTNVDGWPASAH
ncbi:hypothetical protein QWZ10_03680 [Paracoccus cavernae]|uniref:Uncharacterized protein n=2 Tax=Paracoccus cavernae TaxID=1571207 RepID=A0ABT8D422_9RHOB|nr:hypothetical protein [Paracoccus cavernae]